MCVRTCLCVCNIVETFNPSFAAVKLSSLQTLVHMHRHAHRHIACLDGSDWLRWGDNHTERNTGWRGVWHTDDSLISHCVRSPVQVGRAPLAVPHINYSDLGLEWRLACGVLFWMKLGGSNRKGLVPAKGLVQNQCFTLEKIIKEKKSLLIEETTSSTEILYLLCGYHW